MTYSVVSMVGLGITALLVGIGLRAGPAAPPARWPWRLLQGAFVAAVALLAITAYASVWRALPLRGWLLFIHVTAAGGFLALLPVFAVRGLWLLGMARLAAFLVIAAGLLTAVPMLLSMLPWFGTDTLEELLELHRYAGLTLTITVLGQWALSRRGSHPAPA